MGRVLAGVLREVDASGHPLARPCCIVAGGETTVTVRGPGAAAATRSCACRQRSRCAACATWCWPVSAPTAPTVRPTRLARSSTARRSTAPPRWGSTPAASLADNDSYPFFDRLGDLIRTGPTNTNVNDLYLLFAF